MSLSLGAPRVPSYRHHKPSGQAVVTLNGKDHYLGKYRSKPSRVAYERLIAEWLTGDTSFRASDESPTVAELALRYLKFARQYYCKDGRPTGAIHGIKIAVRLLRELYAYSAVTDFGPRALKAIRQRMIDNGNSRRYINDMMDRIKRIFRWGVGEELVPPSVYHGLQAVGGLRTGRSDAREADPILPVADEVVAATLRCMPAVVADMVRFQRFTGCRPGEVCTLRPVDVDISGDVWIYSPESHKTQHFGRKRSIAIGPKAQDVLRPYLLRAAESFCFSPADSEKKRRAEQHARRTTPLDYGNKPGSNRKRHRKTEPGNRYTPDSYRRAIHRAVEKANKQRKKETVGTCVEAELLPKWSPNQLRHTAATEIRRQFGLEAAQVALGHAQANVTEVYAERDLRLATEVARKIG